MRRPALALASALLAACATTPPAQTKIMKESGVVVTAEALRTRLRAMAPSAIGRIERAADAIRDGSSDPAVQRRALILKINAVPVLYQAFYSQQPGAGLADAWAFLIQLEHYAESADGKAAFGPGAPELLAAARDLDARIEETYRWAVPDRDPAPLRARLEAWARQHPTDGNIASRRSLREDLATRIAGDELSAFEAVGVAEEDLRGLIARIDFLPTMVPRQAIWEAELAFEDQGAPRVEQVLRRADAALQRLDHVIAWMGGPGLEGLADKERKALMDAVTEQRQALESLVDAQREQVTRFASQERAQIMAEIDRLRVAAMEDVRRVAKEATEEAARKTSEVVDRALLRAALIVAGAILLWGAVSWVLRRGGRRDAAALVGTGSDTKK
jgi:hypothetical protein